MRLMRLLCALGLSLLAGAAHAQRVTPTLDLAEVRLVVVWTDAAGIRAVRERYERPAGDIRSSASIGTTERNRGFAVLVRSKGELICRLYAERPATVDDDNIRTLGHELAHCLLGEYHR